MHACPPLLRRILSLLLLVTVSFGAACPSALAISGLFLPEPTWEDSSPTNFDPVRQQLDRMFSIFHTMGASVAVFREGEIIFLHTYGLRERKQASQKPLPVTEDTLFQVASISKMVTGIGLLVLADEEKVTLETDIGHIMGFPMRNPAYPDTPITLRQLMSHTAGLRDPGLYQSALSGSPFPLSKAFQAPYLRNLFLAKMEPGKLDEYSNFGGGLAGSLIEALSEETLDHYMQQRVFMPLDITAAYQPGLLPENAKVANMYAMPSRRLTKQHDKKAPLLPGPDPEHNYVLTAGKLFISAPDLAKILIMLCDNGIYQDTRILNASTAREMRTLQSGRGSVHGTANRGLYMNIITNHQVEGRTLYGHGGKANGMLCAAYFDPLDRTGVVMLTNGCNNSPVYQHVGLLGRRILQICYDTLLDPLAQNESPWLVAQ